MSAAYDSSQKPLLHGEPELWSLKPLGWRLLFNDRLLWVALGLSFIAHLVILAPRYGIKLPERSERSLNVSFRTATQPLAPSMKPTVSARPPKQTAAPRKPPRTAIIKPEAALKPSQSPSAPPTAINTLSPAELLSRSAVSNGSQPSSTNGGRRVTLTPNMKDYRYSQYLTDWRLKVERIGAMNYPDEARGRFFGSLVLSVALRPDGSVDRIIVVRSSGNKVLDDAAKRIVMMSSPFAPFPPDIRKETDFLDITRTWTFTRGDALETR